MILRVDREVFDSARMLLSHDTRYFITSIDPSDVKPRDLQKLVRDPVAGRTAPSLADRELVAPLTKITGQRPLVGRVVALVE